MTQTTRILQLVLILWTVCLLALLPSGFAMAQDTDLDEIEEFEETETPSHAESGAALDQMEQMVMSGAPVIDDPNTEASKAKAEAEAAEKLLADAQKRLNEMKLYKASLAQKTRQDLVDSEKRRLEAEKEKATLEAQRKQVELEIAKIQEQQRRIELANKKAKLKAERAKAKLAEAKAKRATKRKATTKTAPVEIKRKKPSMDNSRKPAPQQARI